MPAELLIAPVGAGKTEHALRLIRQTVEARPFAPIWVLLPGRRQEDALRQRLIDEQYIRRRVYFNVSFFNFYTLYARLLDIVGMPQRELDDSGRIRLLRGLLLGLQQEKQLTVFHKIADKPGFAQVMADFIYELKQNVVTPEQFGAYADYGTDKDRDLATIYTQYQHTLRDNQLVDREGEGWLALAETQKPDNEFVGQDVPLMLVDGFDQFNALQTRLLAVLGKRVQRMVITLPTVEGRESTVGRRFHEVQQQVITAFEREQAPLDIQTPPALLEALKHEALRHLAQHSFMNGAPMAAGDGCIKLIEAPDPRAEAFSVMRQVKQLLLTGTQGDEIVIAVRDWELYARHFNTAAQRYGIPTVQHYGEALGNNPAIIALLNMLELSRYDFPRRHVLDVLRSPYFDVPGISQTIADRLDAISHEQQIISSIKDWNDGIQAAAKSFTDEDGETRDALLREDEAVQIEQALNTFFSAVTPPETATVYEYIRWVETLVGSEATPENEDEPDEAGGFSLNMVKRVSHQATPEFVGRDMQALHTLKKILGGMLATENLFAEVKLHALAQTSWHDFLIELKRALGRTPTQNNANRTGHILITSVTDARGLPHEHVFIPGLSEGIFPRPTAEDPIYLDSERELLCQAGILLETQAERAADDGLFYELITLPRRSLTLSRPTVQNGALWPESHLWRAVKVLYHDAETIIERYKTPLGGTVRVEDAANLTEAALAVANSFSQPQANETASPLYNWLLSEYPQYWEGILQRRAIEVGRINDPHLDIYSGQLSDPTLLDWVKRELGDKRVWSASQFNDYGLCGFRFFSKRLLKLEAVEEPEAGMDHRQRGTVIHAILEETYRELAEQAISIVPDHMGTALEVLCAVADRILPTAPRDFGFRESPLWKQEQAILMRKVEALVRADFSDESPIGKLFSGGERFPYLQEQPLGAQPNKPLRLNLGDTTVQVMGFIDRIDRVGDRLIVLDYKTGSTRIPTSEMTEGRNFQMMVYLLAGEEIAAQQNAPMTMAGGTFFHLNRSTSGAVDMDKPEDQTAIDDARLRLGKHIEQGRAGNFSSVSNRRGGGACNHYCEFTQFCRVSIMNRRKQA
ncbi:MAG: PD-(D/E)XK nuclease family protein [Chloroflexi bacterium]|nr:PD-(D/E)XK nuclease family protein [Chloroflexota bacterium]MCC6897086.1 PD-(D/E)XK nuclease family protein [Anaerolineae bacterium]